MNIILLGAAGFIGTNLAIKLAANKENRITLVDTNKNYFSHLYAMNFSNIKYKECKFNLESNYEDLLEKNDVVYHLVSTTAPTTSNQHISEELMANVVVTSRILDACVRCNVQKVVFFSSGGTVYGNNGVCPLTEDVLTNPISSYGVQKLTIEKLLYLYNYLYGLDYKIIRLANPYGPYQRPNGVLGVVSTFTYKALKREKITVYGDGKVVRDFIYIEDAIKAILNIANNNCQYNLFNIGCGYGTSIKELLDIIQKTLSVDIDVEFTENRKADVSINYLDISRYERVFGKLNPISLSEGILRTADFMRRFINNEGD